MLATDTIFLQKTPSRNGREMSRLLTAAVVDVRFQNLLLTDPEKALANGYLGEIFQLATEERSLLLSIHAKTLSDFANQVIERQNNNGYHTHLDCS